VAPTRHLVLEAEIGRLGQQPGDLVGRLNNSSQTAGSRSARAFSSRSGDNRSADRFGAFDPVRVAQAMQMQ
jgi:hypothetical protein